MNFKDNSGVDPVTLSRGYSKLDGDPPNSGENILKPEHVAHRKQMEAAEAAMGMMDDQPIDGFLDRDIPSAYSRPNRTAEEDQG
jgi:hypothetical protein